MKCMRSDTGGTPYVKREGTFGDVPYVRSAGPFLVSLVTHQPATVLAPHRHACATATVVLDGEYAEELANSSYVLAPLTGTIKPAGFVHANRFGARGARSLLPEVEERMLSGLGPASRVLESPGKLEMGPAAAIILELVVELRRQEDFRSVTVQSLVMDWLAFSEDHAARIRRFLAQCASRWIFAHEPIV